MRKSNGNSILEMGPAMVIGFIVLFFLMSLAFYVAGVSTANYACQLAAREGGSGGSRTACQTAAINAAQKVSVGPFGRFVNLRSVGGGAFVDGLNIRFLEVGPGGVEQAMPGLNAVNVNATYQIRVESTYLVGVPFWGNIQGAAASECYIDKPEAMSIP